MENICVTCKKPIKSAILNLSRQGHALRADTGCWVCNECAGKLGIPDGMKGDFTTAKYTVEKFVDEFNRVTGENVSATLAKQAQEDKAQSNRLEKLEAQLQHKVVKKSGLNLRPGEVCYFMRPANAVHLKNVIVGAQRDSIHVGSHFGGAYFGGGTADIKKIRGNVAEKYPGVLFITNQRFILNTPRYSFDIPLTDITTLNMLSDGFVIMGKGNTYTVETDFSSEIKDLLKLNNEYMALKQQANPAPAVPSDKSIPEQLREYKSLLDDGIITQEEFDEKKRQLLNQ